VQSALVPRGAEAAEIDALFWTVTWVSVAVIALVLSFVAVALWGPPRWRNVIADHWVVVVGGIALPVVVRTDRR
jgi:cytochrome c oxidase subunit 2